MMKHCCTIFLLLVFHLIAFGQGVEFNEMTINESLNSAKKEHKHVFIHIGENSCSWGNYSFKVLQASKEAGSFFNKNFINTTTKNKYEYDLVFAITDSPRYFVITPNGKLVLMLSTYKKPERLIRLGQKVLKGKIIKPNSGMYTDKMYAKNIKTLEMLSYTMQAHQLFNFSSDIDYSDADYKLMESFSISDLESCNERLQASFQYGEYYYNQFLMVLIYEISGEREESKKLAKEILDEYPPKEYYKYRVLTDDILLNIIENDL